MRGAIIPMSSLPVNAFQPFGPGIGIWILGFGPSAFISPEYECRIRVFAPASETIRTINGLFARAIDGMPLMRPRPPASTARIAPHARRGTRLSNDRVRTHAADAPLLIAATARSFATSICTCTICGTKAPAGCSQRPTGRRGASRRRIEATGNNHEPLRIVSHLSVGLDCR